MTRIEPVTLRGAAGLSVQINSNGSIRRIDHRDLLVSLFPGTQIEGGPANLYLRRHGSAIESTPLLGPRSPASVQLDDEGFCMRGQWQDIRFSVSLALAQAAPAWFWHVVLENTGAAPVTVDLVHAQDLALATFQAVRMNEYYVSHYVDYTPLAHPRHGKVLAIRQNLAGHANGRHPWAILGSLARTESFATDAIGLCGLAVRGNRVAAGLEAARLPGRRQHEHSMAVLQDEPVQLPPGASARLGFFVAVEDHHPLPSSQADLAAVERTLSLPEAAPPTTARTNAAAQAPVSTLFVSCAPLHCLDLTDSELDSRFGPERRAVEVEDDTLLSFFSGADRHVVTRAKELRVLRPHGLIVRTGNALVPDEASLTTTAWMDGVFHSLLTQGHVGMNSLLSTQRSYLGLQRAAGQRVFVEMEDGYRLLDLPSAFEMTPRGARWIYRHAGGLIEVRSEAAGSRHELGLSIEVLDGPACRFLVSHHIAMGGDDAAGPVPVRFERDGSGVVIRCVAGTDLGRRFPQGSFRIEVDTDAGLERVGGDELLFADGASRAQPFVVLVLGATRKAALRITGGLVAGSTAPADDESRGMPAALQASANSALAPAVAALQDFLPWLAHDALIHYLAPRGLEQYTGGGWGARDVSQGPVELLLALGRWGPLRDLLLRLFAAQNPDGDWPQWFTFFERDRGIRAHDSHGDIVFWPVLALARYLLATEDASILDELVPFFHPQGAGRGEQQTMLAHVERAFEVVRDRTIPGTEFVAYGNGDWDDSLQPANPSMRARLCSSWTVTLHSQTITTLARAFARIGLSARAARLHAQAQRIDDAFRRTLIQDGTIAGFAHFHDDGRIEVLMHPGDHATGLRFRLLPMIHAIDADMLSPQEASRHLGLIRQHLLAPDGARLFDRPLAYHGGAQRFFQRAESATYFGREIGLMYMHAHLRYAQALARMGEADALFLALRQANPIGVHELVASAARRQANCYYSSSDAAFADRYAALSHYADVGAGRVALEGGWRVYSSGAGIALRLILECFLGVRRGRVRLTLDPVIPRALDGLAVEMELADQPVRIVYRVAGSGCGPRGVRLNGTALPFEREDNPYRAGGVVVPMSAVQAGLDSRDNELVIDLG